MTKKLPLVLMSAMVVVGLLMEQFEFGRFQWISKIPVMALLCLGFLISKKRHDAAVR
jgi:hypothetical protein